jgi:ribose 5-phosphate isomerase RpiB
VTAAPRALAIVQAFLDTAFEGGRHERRVEKIADLEHHRGA